MRNFRLKIKIEYFFPIKEKDANKQHTKALEERCKKVH